MMHFKAGGAERLVVDAAVGLQSLDHTVHILTNHHDPARCFEETRNGTLTIKVSGNTIVPPSVRGSFKLPCAILRQLHLVILFVMSQWRNILTRNTGYNYDIIFMDQLSACLPLVRWLTNTRIVFYCHFPDLLTVKQSNNPLRRIYRAPLDHLEGLTTNEADTLLCNSLFTASIIRKTFPSIQKDLQIVYPAIDPKHYFNIQANEFAKRMTSQCQGYFLSINRFEEKKNIKLAIEAFALLKTDKYKLILVGGYDERLKDNVNCLTYLKNHAQELDLTMSIYSDSTSENLKSDPAQVICILNISQPDKMSLLTCTKAVCLLYTPIEEHFGIVPVEAMACGLPVLACNSGGPLETIVDLGLSSDQSTGFLRAPNATTWAEVMQALVDSPNAKEKIGKQGRMRVKDLFLLDSMAQSLQDVMLETLQSRKPRPVDESGFTLFCLVLFLAFCAVVLVPIFSMAWASSTPFFLQLSQKHRRQIFRDRGWEF